MSISASASFEPGGCSYHNLDDHSKKGRKLHNFLEKFVLLGDHEQSLDRTAELSLEHSANICPLLEQ